MKLLSTILLIVGFNFSTYSQSSYQYFYGYEAGFHKACGCTKQIEKTNSLLYHSGTYNDGYSAGFTDGRIYLNQNNNQTNEPDLYSPDYEMIERALQQKQNSLNQRRQLVKSAHENITDILVAAKARNKTLTESQLAYVKWYLEQIDKISSYDFSVDENYNNVMNWFQSVKTEVLKW